MGNTVYDTSFLALSNGDIAARKRGNVFDRRICKIEEFIKGARIAWYNNKLFAEYTMHVAQRRNDVVEAFFLRLADHGKKAKRNTLSTPQYAQCRQTRWPTHDQHLLAAAIEAGNSTIFVTEQALADCAATVKRRFGISVTQIA